MNNKLDEILSRMTSTRRNGDGKWMCRCPAHDDRSASLSIAEKDGQILIHCFAGCEPAAIMGAIGMTMADLWEAMDPSTHYDPPKTGAIPRQSISALFPILITEASILAKAVDELQKGAVHNIHDEGRILLARLIVLDIVAAYRRLH